MCNTVLIIYVMYICSTCHTKYKCICIFTYIRSTYNVVGVDFKQDEHFIDNFSAIGFSSASKNYIKVIPLKQWLKYGYFYYLLVTILGIKASFANKKTVLFAAKYQLKIGPCSNIGSKSNLFIIIFSSRLKTVFFLQYHIDGRN